MDDLQRGGTAEKLRDWITLSLALVFVIVGTSILAGLILSDRVFFQGNIRIIAGLVLTGYGVVRGGTAITNLRSRKRITRWTKRS